MHNGGILEGMTARKSIYNTPLIVLLVIWTVYMLAGSKWSLYEKHWPVALTAALGSFVAGSTPQGGAAVAFPIFTKVLSIDPQISRTFGLMMQSVGMSMAALFIVSRGIKVLPRVILWVSVGGIFGHILGTYFLVIPNPYPRILFTLGAAAFAGVLMITHWWLRLPTHTDLPTWSQPQRLSFIAIGVVGGFMAAHTGSGIDLFTFIVLTLAYGIDERISVPTTVIIMALNSLLGFGLHAAITRDTGMVWNSWLVSIPIVAIGAPFGAYVASRARATQSSFFCCP